MKIIKEHINEKFVEDSDPIHDMGIGIMNQIKKFYEPYKERLDKDAIYPCSEKDKMLICCVDNNKYEFAKYLLDKGANVHTSRGIHQRDEGLPLRYAIFDKNIEMVKLLLSYGASIKKSMSDHTLIELRKRLTDNKELYEILKTAFLNENVNEKFIDDSDPIHDMRIGSGFLRLKNGDILEIKKRIKSENCNFIFNDTLGIISWYPGNCGIVTNVIKNRNETLTIHLIMFSDYSWAIKSLPYRHQVQFSITIGTTTLKNWEEYFKIHTIINEKFTDDGSDPIRDMGIGVSKIIENSFKKIFEEDLKNKIYRKGRRDEIVKFELIRKNIQHITVHNNIVIIKFYSNRYYNNLGKEIDKEKYAIELLKAAHIFECVKLEKPKVAYVKNKDSEYSEFIFEFHILPKYRKYFKTGLYYYSGYNLTESLNEKFIDDSDPIHDMGIGVIHKIKELIKKDGNRPVESYSNLEILEFLLIKEKYDLAEFFCQIKKDFINFEENEFSVLRRFAWRFNFEAAIFLVKHGADIDKAIEFASRKGEVVTTENLIKIKQTTQL